MKQVAALAAGGLLACAGVFLLAGVAVALIVAGVLVGAWALAVFDPDGEGK